MVNKLCAVCGDSLEGGLPHFRMLVPLFHSEVHLPEVMSYLNNLNSTIPGGITVDFVVDGRIEDEIAVSQNLDALDPAAN